MKTIIALALVICQLFTPAAAAVAQAPQTIDLENASFMEMLTVIGAAYQGGWYCGINSAISDDADTESSFAEAAESTSDMPAYAFAAFGFATLTEYADATDADVEAMMEETMDYSDMCFAAYMGYITGYSYGYDEADTGDTSESFAWAFDDIQQTGREECEELGDYVLYLLDSVGMMPEMEDVSYDDVCFGAGCAHNVGWSIGYDKKEAESYDEEALTESILWAANWVEEQEDADINLEGQIEFETVYGLMGNNTDGFEDMTYTVEDFFFASGVAGVAGLYEKLYDDEDNTQVADELSGYNTNGIIYLGLDYFSQFLLAFIEGRIVC